MIPNPFFHKVRLGYGIACMAEWRAEYSWPDRIFCNFRDAKSVDWRLTFYNSTTLRLWNWKCSVWRPRLYITFHVSKVCSNASYVVCHPTGSGAVSQAENKYNLPGSTVKLLHAQLYNSHSREREQNQTIDWKKKYGSSKWNEHSPKTIVATAPKWRITVKNKQQRLFCKTNDGFCRQDLQITAFIVVQNFVVSQ